MRLESARIRLKVGSYPYELWNQVGTALSADWMRPSRCGQRKAFRVAKSIAEQLLGEHGFFRDIGVALELKSVAIWVRYGRDPHGVADKGA